MNTSLSKAIPASKQVSNKPIAKQSPSSRPFFSYLWAENKMSILLTILFTTIWFFLFKLLYPFPDFFSDSYSYIYAAHARLDVNIWPIGYSWFLSLCSWFTHSGAALIWFQYLFFGLSSLYFYHTLVYFYTTGKGTRLVLYLFLFLNPLFCYLANYVTSDCLFAGLSLIWLTQMLWVLNRPALYQVFVQAVIIFVAFTLRYNAMVYPFISAIVFLVSRQKTWVKVAGILSGPILIIPFVIFSSLAAKKMTGTAQFPPILGGWQWGNNALYIRPFVEEDSTTFPSVASTELDRMARKFYQALPPQFSDLPYQFDNFFIVHPASPLKQYMAKHYRPKTQTESVAAWGKVAPVFNEYGHFLVKRHPLAFVRHYMLPNAGSYFIPSMGKLEVYNMGSDEIWPGGQSWFHYASPKIWSISKSGQKDLLSIFPYLFGILNIYFIINLFLYVRRGGLRTQDRFFKVSILTVTAFLLLNFGFSVFANSITMRYEVFPMILLLAFAMLLTDNLEKSSVEHLSNTKQN